MRPNSGPYAFAVRMAGILALISVGAIVLLSGGPGSPRELSFTGTVYVESNASAPGANQVLAFHYSGASLRPVTVTRYPTGGSGSRDLSNGGVLDADQQVMVDRSRMLLFAVNQGSDTVAVFGVGAGGTLTPVPGSPFAAGGLAPASVGLVGQTAVVADKAQDGVRPLAARPAGYATFTVEPGGALRPAAPTVPLPPGSSPTQAFAVPGTDLVVSTEETGLLRTFRLRSGGTLVPGLGSPFALPASVFPGAVRRSGVWPAGLSASPTAPVIYTGIPNLGEIAVYSYDAGGRLGFVASVGDRGASLPCWSAVSRDGRRLYTANAGSDSVSVFDVGSDPRRPRQLQVLTLRGQGNPWNMAIDDSGRFLFVVTPRAVRQIPAGQGNTLHVLQVRADGTLAEPAASPTAIPVPVGVNPLGLAIVPGRG